MWTEEGLPLTQERLVDITATIRKTGKKNEKEMTFKN